MAYRYDLRIEQGADFVLTVECDIDLTGYTAASQVRKAYSSPLPLASASCSVDGPGKTVEIRFSAAQTSAMPAGAQAGVWDCELTAPGGTVQRLVEGRVSVSPEVTK